MPTQITFPQFDSKKMQLVINLALNAEFTSGETSKVLSNLILFLFIFVKAILLACSHHHVVHLRMFCKSFKLDQAIFDAKIGV